MYDEAIQNTLIRQKVQSHHTYINSLVSWLCPDFFDEDPRIFLGDHNGYFKIVKKRGIGFFYFSRLLLYLFCFVIILNYIKNKKQEPMEEININKSKFVYI